ncbi:hypothetical protein [Lichenicoccus sp.]|uniref:hypothetical protein n=1 Tax=Lichenicoccus sp. TaxID=2781899 RepID=UPI003D149710
MTERAGRVIAAAAIASVCILPAVDASAQPYPPPPPGWAGPHYYWHGQHWHHRAWAYGPHHRRYWRYY